MTETIINDKRTRSQLHLTDEILQLSQRSPLKDARIALRNHSATAGSSSPDTMGSGVAEETDDELLLSPRKDKGTRPVPSGKRSASPPVDDEYSTASNLFSLGRELKRARRDVDLPSGGEIDVENSQLAARRPTLTHIRNNSEPIAGTSRKSTRKRSATSSTSKKPHSSSGPHPPSCFPSTSSQTKERARSVPLFPSTVSIPHLDLRNPPPSPRRARSRPPSTEREPKLRITSNPILTTAMLDTIIDEGSTCMDVDETHLGLDIIPQRIDVPVSVSTEEPSSLSTTPPTDTYPLPHFSIDHSDSTTAQPPSGRSTPVPSHLHAFSIPMSPLTPIPDTPHFSKLTKPGMQPENRYTAPGWGANPLEEDEDEFTKGADAQQLPQLFMPVPPTKPSKQSRLPRPSSNNNLASAAMVSLPPPSTPGKPEKTTSISSTNQAVTSKPAKKDAFKLMMQTAANKVSNTKLLKGKGKEKAITKTSKAISSSSTSKSTFPSSAVPALSSSKTKVQTLVKQKEEAKPKVSIKAKMRPREKAPKPTFVPPPLPVDEEDVGPEVDPEADEEGEVSQQEHRLPSPPRVSSSASTLSTLSASRPSSPLVQAMDLSMQDIMDVPTPAPDPIPQSMVDSKAEPGSGTTSLFGSPLDVKGDLPDTEPQEFPEAVNVDPAATEEGAPPRVDPSSMEVPSAVVGDEVMSEATTPVEAASIVDPQPKFKAGVSRLPQKKRVPSAAAPVERVTRSVSMKRKEQEAEGSTLPGRRALASKKSLPAIAPPSVKKTPVSASAKKDKKDSDVIQDQSRPESKMVPPDSPMKLSSPTRLLGASDAATAVSTKTPSRLKAPVRSNSSPSPTKLVRAASMFSERPTGTLSRTYTTLSTTLSTAGPSSLSTLANALEKLRMPPPARPNTSMGFNPDADDDGDNSFDFGRKSKDDGVIGSAAHKQANLSRTSTVGPRELNGGSSSKTLTATKPGTSKPKPLALGQRPMTMFLTGEHTSTGAGRQVSRPESVKWARDATAAGGTKPRIFGVGAGEDVRRSRSLKVSRNPSLPSVMASPVKGAEASTSGKSDDDADIDLTVDENKLADQDVFWDKAGGTSLQDPGLAANALGSGKGKGKEQLVDSSSGSQALSQSLSAMPTKPPIALGLMGPPATPHGPGRSGARSTSSTYPSSAGSTSSNVADTNAHGTGMSTAKSAPGALNKIRGGVGGHFSSQRKGTVNAAATNAEPLTIFKDCVVFVDVRTDEGEEVGSLFTEMLEGASARILTRVGQTCTHIVYKNALMSTLTRYRALRDPKPFVVGIGWVVECIEQRTKVDETKFLVDLDSVDVGTNKRRRSMLPKMIIRPSDDTHSSDAEREEGGNADLSMDGSTSSTMDDDLPPLEKARRRKSMLIGMP